MNIHIIFQIQKSIVSHYMDILVHVATEYTIYFSVQKPKQMMSKMTALNVDIIRKLYITASLNYVVQTLI